MERSAVLMVNAKAASQLLLLPDLSVCLLNKAEYEHAGGCACVCKTIISEWIEGRNIIIISKEVVKA